MLVITASNKTSLRALNWLNFFAADVSTGVGPFLAIYLTSNRHWDASKIGIVISAMSISTVLFQSPAGLFIDKTPYKRFCVIMSSVLIGCGALVIFFTNNLYSVVIAQVIMGISAAFFIPTLIALALGIGGDKNFDKTISINQTFNHAGNVTAAVVIGVIGHFTKNEGIFFGLCAFCVLSILSSVAIREQDIDQNIFKPTDQKKQNKAGSAILGNRDFMILLIVSVFFHFANAAMLPLVGQELGRTDKSNASLYMAACIIIAQLVMVPISYYSSNWVINGRKKILLVGFLILPIRGIMYTFWDNAVYLVSVQILDGIAAGIFGVVSILMVSDMFKGTGRANFAQGILAAAIGLGASLSNLGTGFLVKSYGFNAGFLSLSALAALAFTLLWLAMPETLNINTKKINK